MIRSRTILALALALAGAGLPVPSAAAAPPFSHPVGPAVAAVMQRSEASLGDIQVVGEVRAQRTVRIHVDVSAAVGLLGRLTRTVRGRTVVVRRFGVGGGPGTVEMRFRAPEAGLYRIVVSAGDVSRERVLRVTR